ncbi:pumilio domain member 6 [Lunasporangiospora selenospora]|uniref:Pumilio domain member 6 n=1 Tax=Lunasporangiospora selenospora TaxID=979761 RepID=A0A9P6FVF7_9FUNG|nr:pumilio domain member 6 [Lunasporangiospora selenospora]
MAVAKRKSVGVAHEAPSKKAKESKADKSAKPAQTSVTGKKTIFGKVLEEEDEDEGELQAEPIRDDDEDNGMEVDGDAAGSQSAPQKPKLSTKESNAQKKALREERRSHKPNSELIYPAKKIWERLRRKDLAKDERKEVMKEMMDLITGKVQEIIFKHDMSRIIQSCLKYGNEDQRNVIAGELVGYYLTLSKSMYGRFIVVKILHFCPKYRDTLIKEFYGRVRQLIRHKEAASVIEDAYSNYANAGQRNGLIQEFYGPEFRIFKNDDKKTLTEILETHPAKKDSIMKHLMETLTACLEKGTVGYSIVHRGLLEYFEHADAKGIQEMLEVMKEQAVEMLHTKEGAQVAMLCLLYATPKDRKAMLKSMKPFVVKICKEEYGHMVMLRMFDVVDDTVLMSKAIIAEITKELVDIANDKFGRRVILYLLAGRSPKYISPMNIDLLAKGDTVRANTSKKDAAIRSSELLGHISPALISTLAERTRLLTAEPLSCQVVLETLLHASGDRAAAVNALLELAAADPANQSELEPNPLTKMPTDRLYKTLVQSDYKAPMAEPSLNFGSQLLKKISPYIGYYAQQPSSSFVVLSLLENPATAAETKKLLTSKSGSSKSTVQKELEKLVKNSEKGVTGAKLILEALAK